MNPPSYELRAVFSDSAEGTPEIIPVTAMPWEAATGRRGFLGSGLALGAVLGSLTSCQQAKPPPMAPPVRHPGKSENVSFRVFDKKTNSWRTEVLPCGSPTPPGAICTCNCVPVSVPSPPPVRTTHTYTTCTCNKVCTCVPVYR